MDIEIRPVEPDDWPAMVRVAVIAFGEELDAEKTADEQALFEFERGMAAFDGDRMVGTGGAYSLELTLPGGVQVPAGGLTWISVLPTHRRRGILRAIMRRHFEDVQARGEAISVLGASESLIYGRFGYGIACMETELEIDPRRAAFAAPVPTPTGRVRIVDAAEARTVLPQVFDRGRRAWPGQVSRNGRWWDHALRDPESRRRGRSRRVDVVHEPAPGRVDGYVSYRIKERWTAGLPDNRVEVQELVALTTEAAAALWGYCTSMDLVSAVRLLKRPVDDPVRWLLADPRRLRTLELVDGLWVRLLDLPAALAARRYAAEGRLVLEVTDGLQPANEGRFALEAGPDGASCRPTAADPDLVLDVAELGAAFLGGVRFATLARAGRVLEGRPGGLRRADAMFASDPAPWCSTGF